MNRLKKTLFSVLVSIVLLYFLMMINELYFTQEKAFRGYERGYHYGPAEEILEMETLGDGTGYVLALWDGELEILEMRRKVGLFWQPVNTYLFYEENPEAVSVRCLPMTRQVIVCVSDSEITEVTYGIEMNRNAEDSATVTDTVQVGERGYAVIDYSDQFQRYDTADYYPGRIIGRNAVGEVIYDYTGVIWQ